MESTGRWYSACACSVLSVLMFTSLYPVYKSVYTAMVRVPFLFHDYFMSIRTSWKSVTRHNKGEMTSTRSSTRARHVAQHVAQPCTGPLGTQPLSALPAFPGSLGDCSHQVWLVARHSLGWGCSTCHIWIEGEGGRGGWGGGEGAFLFVYLVCQQKKRSCGSEANFAQNIQAQRSIYLLFIDSTILANLVTIRTLSTDHTHSEYQRPINKNGQSNFY